MPCIDQIQPLKPKQAATIAGAVYEVKQLPFETSLKSYLSSPETRLRLGCEDEFEIQDKSGFHGKSGGYIFRKLLGFGYACKGAGMRAGQILVATRGTSNSAYDWITDAQAAPVPWKGGSFVHNGFKRVFDTYVDQLDDFMGRQCVSHVHCVSVQSPRKPWIRSMPLSSGYSTNCKGKSTGPLMRRSENPMRNRKTGNDILNILLIPGPDKPKTI